MIIASFIKTHLKNIMVLLMSTNKPMLVDYVGMLRTESISFRINGMLQA